MQIEAREKMKGFFQKIPEQEDEKTQKDGDQKGKKRDRLLNRLSGLPLFLTHSKPDKAKSPEAK
jgi:hypothetical protein